MLASLPRLCQQLYPAPARLAWTAELSSSADARLASAIVSDMILANMCAYCVAAKGESQVPKFCGKIDARDMRQDRGNHGQQAESHAILPLKVAMFISPEGQLDNLSCFICQAGGWLPESHRNIAICTTETVCACLPCDDYRPCISKALRLLYSGWFAEKLVFRDSSWPTLDNLFWLVVGTVILLSPRERQRKPCSALHQTYAALHKPWRLDV